MPQSTPLPDLLDAATDLAAASSADRVILLDVCWRVHAPATGPGEIASTALAGVTLECNRPADSLCEYDGLSSGGALTLTFWCDRPQGRATLAVYCSKPKLKIAAAPASEAHAATFQLAVHRAGWSVDVTANKPVLRFTHIERGGADGTLIACCRSILPELLGLRGGQYRLAEVHVERAARLGSMPPPVEARHAV